MTEPGSYSLGSFPWLDHIVYLEDHLAHLQAGRQAGRARGAARRSKGTLLARLYRLACRWPPDGVKPPALSPHDGVRPPVKTAAPPCCPPILGASSDGPKTLKTPSPITVAPGKTCPLAGPQRSCVARNRARVRVREPSLKKPDPTTLGCCDSEGHLPGFLSFYTHCHCTSP